MKKIIIGFVLCMSMSEQAFTRECRLSNQWQGLCSILQKRVAQTHPKMKLRESDAMSLEDFLNSTKIDFPNLIRLQSLLPKTTTELLMSVHKRGVTPHDAELMADYLKKLVEEFQFQKVGAFDENTSHIIGREWHEIDYSGEGMTWEKQKAHYAPYGIDNFKSQACLAKFFPVESKLPYFRKIYKPRSSLSR
jgi:hypothetical protein